MILHNLSLFQILSVLCAFIFQIGYASAVLKKNVIPSIPGWTVFVSSAGAVLSSSYFLGAKDTIPLLLFLFVCNSGLLILSFFYGNRSWSSFEKISIAAVTTSFFIWWYFNNPWSSFICAMTVDTIGYVLFAKSLINNKAKESISLWILSIITFFFAILATDITQIKEIAFPAVNFIGGILICVSEIFRRKKFNCK